MKIDENKEYESSIFFQANHTRRQNKAPKTPYFA